MGHSAGASGRRAERAGAVARWGDAAMKILEIHLGYKVSFDQLESVVYARVENDAQFRRPDLPADDTWVILASSNGPCTLAEVQNFYRVYPAPEDAIRGSIDRAHQEIADSHEKIARLSAALVQESEAS